MNGMHDVGGTDGFGPIEREENEPVFHEPWEARMRAITTLVIKKCRIYNLDEGRHASERMHPVFYLGSSYYQTWLLRLEALLLEKGVLTEEEIADKRTQISPVSYTSHLQPYRKVQPLMPSVQRREVLQVTRGTRQKNEPIQPKFAPGTVVRVKEMSPLGHTRVPRYIRGKVGVVEECHGNYFLPDVRVHEGIDVYQPVYQIRFNAQDIWGEDASPNDKLLIEMWEDYLEWGGTRDEKQ